MRIFKIKSRSMLTIIAIAIGVFAVTVISCVSGTASAMIDSKLCSMGINSVLIEAGKKDIHLTDSDVQAVSQLDGIGKAMPLMMKVTQCRVLDKSLKCMAWGVNSEAGDIISLEAIHGRLINDGDISAGSDVCVIDAEIAGKTYGRENIVGKKISLNLNGKYREFEVIGVATSGLNSLQSMISDVLPFFVYLPYTTVQNLSSTEYYDKIALSLNDESVDGNALNDIEACFTRIKGENSVKVNNLLSQKQQLDGIMSAASASLSLVAGISLIVSALSVAGNMLISVSERRREIGIKKALGAKNSKILAEFLIESVGITVVGSVFGAIIGLIATALGCLFLGVPFIVDFNAILFSLVLCAGLGVIAGGYPAYKAAVLKPIEALKG